MTTRVCPAAVIPAPVERVWALLADPLQYDRWQDIKIFSIQPEGGARPGQVIHSRSTEIRRVRITMQVGEVDERRHAIELTTRFSFGLEVRNHIQCTALGPFTCRVQFG